MKKCAECKLDKPLNEFHKSKKMGSFTYCKSCSLRLQKEQTSAMYNVTKKYGITVGKLYTLLQQQNGKCAICKKEIIFKTEFHQLRACVDHAEGTLNIRGLLCTHCNTGLGLFKHNTNFLSSAINYLNSPIVHQGDENAVTKFKIQKRRTNTSGYLGVTFDKSKGLFKAKLSLMGKIINIGYYDHREQAALAYNDYIKLNIENYSHIVLNDVPEDWTPPTKVNLIDLF